MSDSQGNIYFNPSLQEIAEKKLSKVQRPLTPREAKVKKIGRNSPCMCGSGIKFKKCCYGKETSPS